MSASETSLEAQPVAERERSASEQPARYGEVFDRGYKHYEGRRLGRGHAQWALARYSIRRALGIKKSWTAKVIPILLYVAVTFPVIISIGIRAFAPDANILDYPDFFAFIFVIEGIFVATIAPEMLCGDRRENVLPLYFSRAITRLDYLLAKLFAAALLTLTISLIPAAVLWLGRQLLAEKPVSALGNNIDDLGRIVVAGTMIAFYLGAIGLLISSFTGRKSVAVAVIVLGFIIAEAITGALVTALDNDTLEEYLLFLSPTSTIANLTSRLFDDVGIGVEAPLWKILAVMAGVVVACCAGMYWRYVPDE